MKKSLAVGLTLFAAVACDDPAGPEHQHVVGSYAATSFTTTQGGTTTDQLALGASLDLTLNANGTVTGELVAPFGSPSQDMAGTWTHTGNTVTFAQQADTFVRDMPFTVIGNTLVGDETFSGSRIQVTLTRQ
ncbi:MAG TPA: hypothetical protein VEB19_00375 [Gemmatimonadaceae bacterium]|nr:hypothetical protein [Gemmatimonadaceae bacterium]